MFSNCRIENIQMFEAILRITSRTREFAMKTTTSGMHPGSRLYIKEQHRQGGLHEPGEATLDCQSGVDLTCLFQLRLKPPLQLHSSFNDGQ